MSFIKGGKRSLTDKVKGASDYNDIFGNPLTISPELKKEIKDQGLAHRFIDYKRYKEMDGYHSRGWKVYKRKNTSSKNSDEFTHGSNPDGYVRRGTVILAVRPVEINEKHKQVLKNKAELYSRKKRRKNAKDLRQMADEGGLDTMVSEDYGD